jgi:hypothetical protein
MNSCKFKNKRNTMRILEILWELTKYLRINDINFGWTRYANSVVPREIYLQRFANIELPSKKMHKVS